MWVCPQSISPNVKIAKLQTATKTEKNLQVVSIQLQIAAPGPAVEYLLPS